MNEMNIGQEEEMDWKLFLLLEGELDASEQAEVLKKIDEDPKWSKAWKLMQLSVLPAEKEIALSETEKKSLRKTNGRVLPISLNASWFSYAAAASVILLAFWFWQKPKHEPIPNQKNPGLTETITTPPQVITDKDTQIKASIPAEPEALQTAEAKPSPHGGFRQKQPEKISVDSLLKEKPLQNQPTEQLAVLPKTRVQINRDRTPIQMPSVIYTKSYDIQAPNSAPNRLDQLAHQSFNWFNNAQRIWSAIQDPELNFRRVKTSGGPGIAIDFKSHGYGASAQLIVKNDFIQNLKLNK